MLKYYIGDEDPTYPKQGLAYKIKWLEIQTNFSSLCKKKNSQPRSRQEEGQSEKKTEQESKQERQRKAYTGCRGTCENRRLFLEFSTTNAGTFSNGNTQTWVQFFLKKRLYHYPLFTHCITVYYLRRHPECPAPDVKTRALTDAGTLFYSYT